MNITFKNYCLFNSFINERMLITNVNFISGYSCSHCWSTKEKTECPCTAEYRATTGHGSGGKSPTYATASVISPYAI